MSFNLTNVVSGLFPTQELRQAIRTNREFFSSFGAKDSHKLRKQLFQIFDNVALPPDARFFFYFLCAHMNNRARILSDLQNLPDAIKGLAWFGDLTNFFDNNTCGYPAGEEPGAVFACIHVPQTLPPLSMYCYCIGVDQAERNINNLVNLQYFGQLNLNDDLQARHKTAMENFWTNTVRTTRRRDRPQAEVARYGTPQAFDGNYYDITTARDKYILVSPTTRQAVNPTDVATGYTEAEIVAWANTFAGL